MEAYQTETMDGKEELYSLFRECYPGVILSEEYAKKLMTDADNVCFESRSAEGKLQGILLLKENSVLMFCVAPQFRGQGIGSGLLEEAERFLLQLGVEEIRLCEAGEYLTPGAPMYPGNREYFEKRGYVHQGDENRSVDMMVDFSKHGENMPKPGDTIDGIIYRWATPEDREGAVNCAGDALPQFAEFYWDEKLYQPDSMEKVLVAVKDIPDDQVEDPAEKICGVLLVNLAGEMPGIGSIGCTSVRPSCAGRGIATNLVRIATGEMRAAGLEKGYLSYTYGDIVHMYGRSGFEISMRYFMGKKKLEKESVKKAEPVVEKKLQKEVVLQYMEMESRLDDIEKRIYDNYQQQGGDPAAVEKLQIYIKPQDFAVYYVINDTHFGKVAIF